jgi:hypothetical protein
MKTNMKIARYSEETYLMLVTAQNHILGPLTQQLDRYASNRAVNERTAFNHNTIAIIKRRRMLFKYSTQLRLLSMR